MAKKTDVTVFEDQLAALAAETLEAEQSSQQIAFLSTQGGTLKYRGNPIAGNALDCVILAAPVERLYYSQRYDPAKIVPPDCAAISILATGMKPVETAPAKQHATCEGCPKNEWGSSPTGGKGKACRETRRLLLIPADALTSAAAVETAEVAALRPPVTSLKNYATYAQTIAATYRRPPLSMITKVAVLPDPKTQFKVAFNMVKPIEDQSIIQALIIRAKKEAETAIANSAIALASPEQSEEQPQSTRF
jgi:hypothetical protein